MPIVLDHTIVPAYDNTASARFFARIFGLQFEAPVSHFAPVRVNDVLVLDFDTRTTFEPHQGKRSGLRRHLSTDRARRHCLRQRPAVT
jgi:hypothetical protein